MGKGLLGAGKALVGQLTDGQKGVNVGEVLKGGVQGAVSGIPVVGGLAANAIGNMGGGQQQQAGQAAPALPGQPQPGNALNNLIQQAHGGMVYHSAGGPTPEQLAEASQILANMGKEEKLAKYGMMSDEAILQEIAKSLDGGEAAPTPDQPEAQAGDRAYFEDKVTQGDSPFAIRTQHEIDMLNAAADRRREENIQDRGNRSLAQAFADELSQIGAGFASGSQALDDQMRKSPYGRGEYGGGPADPSTAKFPDYFGAFARGYGEEEDRDRARMHSGAKGYLDAYNPFTMMKDFTWGAEVTSPGEAAFQPGRGARHALSKAEKRLQPVSQFRGGKNPRVKLRKRY